MPTILLPFTRHSLAANAAIVRAAAAASVASLSPSPGSSSDQLRFRAALDTRLSPVDKAAVERLIREFPALLDEKLTAALDSRHPSDVEEALDGCDGAVLSSGSAARPDEVVDMEASIVSAANKLSGGVNLVKVSGPNGVVSERALTAMGRAHWQVEQMLWEAAGARSASVVRGTTSMQVLLEGRMRDMICGRTLSMPGKQGKIAFLHPSDLAEVVAQLLSDPVTTRDNSKQVYALTGPGTDHSFDSSAAWLAMILTVLSFRVALMGGGVQRVVQGTW